MSDVIFPPDPPDQAPIDPNPADPGDGLTDGLADEFAASLSLTNGEAAAAVYRTPPHNIEAEKALLGAVLIHNRAYEQVSEFLRAEHFSIEQHGKVFAAAGKLIDAGQIADPVTLKRYFENEQSLAEIGGPAYLAALAGSAVTVINAREYGRIIYDLFLKRKLIELGEDLVNRAYGGPEEDIGDTATGQIERAEQSLYDLATAGDTEGGFQDFKQSLIKAINIAETAHKRDGGLAGVPTGLRDLDKLLGGMHPSDLIVLAGRPSMGKTALATNMAFNMAQMHRNTGGEEGAVVGFFSLEMSAEQLAARILSQATEISSDKMRKGELSNEEFVQLAQYAQALYDSPIFIDDTPGLTVSALRTRARRLKRKHNLDLIVIDYLQLVSGVPGARPDSRVQEVSEITRGLKTLAKELNVPVIALSQLSRAVESREPPRPQLADLRESGSIEQDADVVMFIYREEYYLERKKPGRRVDEDEGKFVERESRWEDAKAKVANMADVIVAKQRHGPIGDVRLFFDGNYTRFGNLDTTDYGR